jgi:hypothetical protein
MGRYNLNEYDNDDFPFWAKALACLVVAGIAAVWHRCQTGQW